jgi:2C-methyl-D-erythritol 2,4-cyclodiphosphate synthase
MKCKIAMEKTPVCGKDICCCFCPDVEECVDACSDDFKGCSEFIQEETELQVMQSAVPEAIRIITEISIQKQKLEEQEKLMRKKLIEAMETYGVKKFENAQVAFTYVAPTTRISIDSTKLKKKYPAIAEECFKVSNVSASVKINVK